MDAEERFGQMEFDAYFDANYHILGLCARRLAGEGSGEDLLHRVYCDAVKFIAGGGRINSPKVWICERIRFYSVREFITAHRHSKLIKIHGAATLSPKAEDCPERRCILLEILDCADKTIKKLPESKRVPFLMHLEGIPVQEIADRMGVPLKTAASRIREARLILKEALRRFVGDESGSSLVCESVSP